MKNQPTAPQPLFALGQITIVPAVYESIQPEMLATAIGRHSVGDWDVDQEYNEASFAHGREVIGEFDLGELVVWIVTTAERTETTVITREEGLRIRKLMDQVKGLDARVTDIPDTGAVDRLTDKEAAHVFLYSTWIASCSILNDPAQARYDMCHGVGLELPDEIFAELGDAGTMLRVISRGASVYRRVMGLKALGFAKIREQGEETSRGK